MAHFDLPEGSRAGSVTEFGRAIELLKSCQKAMDLLEKIKPDIEELYHLLYLFDDEKEFYNAIVDLYIYDYKAEQCLIDKAKELKELINIDS